MPTEAPVDTVRAGSGPVVNDTDDDWVDDRQSSVLLPSSGSNVSSDDPNDFHGDETPQDSTERHAGFGWSGVLNRFRRKPERQGPANTDGVFGNLVAKDDDSSSPPEAPTAIVDDDVTPAEEPPTYEEASADATPSYWETTVMATDWGEEVIVGDMPVGTVLHFAWNILVSVAFSYVGFFISYLFHTSHAARCGSITGLGVTLIQSSYDWRSAVSTAPGPPPDEFAPKDPNSFEDGPAIGYVMHPTGQSASHEGLPEQSDWKSNVMFGVGVFLFLKGVFDYVRARALEAAILRQQADAQAQAQVNQSSSEEAV